MTDAPEHKTDTQDPVLIVGAGPTGLMMACCLRLWGIPSRIIDPKSGPLKASRALGVHARTLEAFRQLGIADYAVARGKVGGHIHFYVDGERVQKVTLGEIGTGLSSFPYILFLDQPVTETLLIDKLESLGGSVDWGWRATGLQDGLISLEGPDGEKDIVSPRYIIGADGAHSIIREGAGIARQGDSRDQLFFVADLAVTGDVADDAISVFLCDDGFSAFFPKTGEDRLRLVGVTPEGYRPAKDQISFDEMRGLTMNLLKRDLQLAEPDWISTYHVHHKVVTQFSKGNVFLAGDAAHVHSPIGAQGMNTGLLDAHNLAWKMAMVLEGRADQAILQSYDDERRPFANRLINTTDQAFVVVTSKTKMARFVRRHFVPRMFKYALRLIPLRRLAFRTASQIGIRYGKSPLNGPSARRRSLLPGMTTPSPGDRFPGVHVRQRDTGQECDALSLVRYEGFTLLNFGEQAETDLPLRQIMLTAVDPKVHKKIKGRSFLVRPDLVVALSMKGVDESALQNWFKRLSP